MISCASCQHALASRSKKLTLRKTEQLNKQKATWNISHTLILFCLILYWADSMAGKVKPLSSWGLWNWQIGSRLLLYMNSEHPSKHYGQPMKYNKKLEYGCLAADLTLITEVGLSVFDSVSRWQNGKGTWPHGRFLLRSPRCEEDGSTVAVCSDRLLERKPV